MISTPYVLCFSPLRFLCKNSLSLLSSPLVSRLFVPLSPLFGSLFWVGVPFDEKRAHKTGSRTYILGAQSYHEVTQKSKRKTLALGTSIADVFKRVWNLNIPAISHSLRRDHVTAFSAEFCTLQFDKKLSRNRQLLSSFLANSQLFSPAWVGRLRLASVFWK